MPKKRSAKRRPDEHNGWLRADFIDYLKNTLIPDLKESGRDMTAEDFETAVFFMEDRDH